MELIQELVSKLGISDDQAKGGVGLLLDTARSQLDESDYATIKSAIPGADDMLSAAPNMPTGNTGTAGMLGGLGDMLGGGSDGGSMGGGLGGALGGMLGDAVKDSDIGGQLGGMLGNLDQLGGLLEGFQNLKMDGDTLQKFLPIVLSFLQSKDSEGNSSGGIGDILGKVFG